VAAVAGGRKEGAPFEPSAWDKFQWADSIGSSYLGSQSDFLNITKENSCDIYIYIYTYNPCNYGYISVKFSGTAASICTSMLDILSDMVGYIWSVEKFPAPAAPNGLLLVHTSADCTSHTIRTSADLTIT
jgi:hypothetical protein